MKTLSTTFSNKTKVSIKLNTKLDEFFESAVNVGDDNWVVFKRNCSEGGVDIKFLDKFTPSTQELAHFEDGKFNFSNYLGQLKFINLFKKHPKLKRELLKVSYPLGNHMNVSLDLERFKRSMKYYKLKLFRSVKYNFPITFPKIQYFNYLVLFLLLISNYIHSQSSITVDTSYISRARKEMEYNLDSLSFNVIPKKVIYHDKDVKFQDLPQFQQQLVRLNCAPYTPLNKTTLEAIGFKNKRTIVFFYTESCRQALNMKPHILNIKKTDKLDIIMINISENIEYWKSILKHNYAPVVWFLRSNGQFRQHIGENDVVYRKIDAFIEKKYKFL